MSWLPLCVQEGQVRDTGVTPLVRLPWGKRAQGDHTPEEESYGEWRGSSLPLGLPSLSTLRLETPPSSPIGDEEGRREGREGEVVVVIGRRTERVNNTLMASGM